MDTEELKTRIAVGRKPVLVYCRAYAPLPGWYVFVEVLGKRDVEVRFQATPNEEGGVSFYGTYPDTEIMLSALIKCFGEVASWEIDESPAWPDVDRVPIEAMRTAIRRDALTLPEGIDRGCRDPYWGSVVSVTRKLDATKTDEDDGSGR